MLVLPDLQSIIFVSMNSLSRMMELTSTTSMDLMHRSAKTLRWQRMTSNREFTELMQQHYSIVQLKTHHGIIKPRLPPQIITPKLSSVSQAQT